MSAANWQEVACGLDVPPRPVETSRRAGPPWPERLAPEALHGVAGEFVRLVEPHTEADPAALLVQLLVAFGSIAGRSVHFRHESTQHAANLYVALVGATSRARKGTSWDWVRRVAATVDPTWTETRLMNGLSSGEGLIAQVRDPVEVTSAAKRTKASANSRLQTEIVARGVSDKRLLVQEGELAQALRALQRAGNTLSPVLRTAWDSGSTLRTMVKNSPTVATGAHVSIVGHITVDELRRLLTESDVRNGLANRFLWCCVRRSKELPEGGDLPSDRLVPIANAMREAAKAARANRRIERSPAAREVWQAVYRDLTREVPGFLGDVTARAEAQLLRLSLVYALLDESPTINEVHLTAALAVWDYCAASAAHIFGGATGDLTADRIQDALRVSPEGLTRAELRDLFKGHKSAQALDAALAILVRSGQAVSETKETGGRSATVWRAAPAGRRSFQR